MAQITLNSGFLGRIVTPLGTPLDGKGSLSDDASESRSLESRAPGIMDRRSVHEPFATGVTAVDAMIPIGRGQRELIIGDRQTGKTTVAVDAILNQTDVLCVYVAVGQKTSTVAEMISGLARTKDMSFMYKGNATCSVYDDLTKHAIGYREMCLLLRRPPAREAYPQVTSSTCMLDYLSEVPNSTIPWGVGP